MYPSLTNTTSRGHGFSLVELSVVLVILGLLVGGIMAGQSLIQSSELRSITTEYQRYIAAIQAFESQYNAIPGDMNNATLYWGKDNVNCPTNSGVISPLGTCNGNGNGTIGDAAGPNATGENLQIWRHLSLAGLISGRYTGISGNSGKYDVTLGSNSPASKVKLSGWMTYNFTDFRGVSYFPGNTELYAYEYGNMLIFSRGMDRPNVMTPVRALTAADAWSVDEKLDDGMPGRGKIVGYWDQCATSASPTDYDGVYNLENPDITCTLSFVNVY